MTDDDLQALLIMGAVIVALVQVFMLVDTWANVRAIRRAAEEAVEALQALAKRD